jgi:hypothetical protein
MTLPEVESTARDKHKFLRLGLLLWLLLSIVIGLQAWVGSTTIYAQALEAQREALHFAVLHNKAPNEGGWAAVGALSIQKRVGIVYLAEAIRHSTGWSIGKIYQLLDTIFLFISLLALFFYLRRWLPDIYCLVGVLYFCAVLPMTYFFQLFHPWDRLQLAIWIGLLCWIAQRQFVVLALGLVISIIVKFDTVLLPLLYAMVHFNRRHWQAVLLESIVLLALAFGTYTYLGYHFPAPLDESHFTWIGVQSLFQSNGQAMSRLSFRYPPLLVHALALLMALFYLGAKDRLVRASVAFALGMSVVFAVFTHYEEVRAHMVVLVLLLPSALISLMIWLEGRAPTQTQGRKVVSPWISHMVTADRNGLARS